MKTLILFFSLLLFGSAGVFSRAGQIEFAPGFEEHDATAAEPGTPVPLASGPNAFTDFVERVRAALERRDLARIAELYQTNAVTPDDMKREFARWQPVVGQANGSKASLFFKELGKLPPTARQVWGGYARGLTSHQVTHLGFLDNGGGVKLMLPLIEFDGRLWIVPSDKVQPGSCIKPGGVVNDSQPARAETNGISGTAGSRR